MGHSDKVSGTEASDFASFDFTTSGNNDRLLLVAAFGVGPKFEPFAVDSVTYNGVNMTRAASADLRDRRQKMLHRSEVFYLLEADMPVSGAHPVEIHFSHTPDSSIEYEAIEHWDATQEAPSTGDLYLQMGWPFSLLDD